MVFPTVIAAVDGTRAGFEAGRQAARLTSPDGRLILVAVVDPYLAMFNRWGGGRLVEPEETDGMQVLTLATERLNARAAETVEAMRGQVADAPGVTTRVAHGRSFDALRELGQSEGADLIALGSHGGTRLAGIALGSTATELLHDAPCSVLAARTPFDVPGFPRRIVVGVDGSSGSRAALDVARAIHGADGDVAVRVVAARGNDLDDAALASLAAPFPVDRRPQQAADALIEAAEDADLLVVGARGLSGARSLGSVSERVAHRAPCSVLVVRSAP